MRGPLADRLALIAADFHDRLGDYSRAIDQLVARLHAAEATRAIPALGEEFPDFILPDAQGKLWHLAEALGDGPVLLSFHRGYWCDFCNLNMKALAELSTDLAAHGCRIAAIAPQNAVNVGLLARDAGAEFPVLCDVDLALATSLGLVYVVGDTLQDELARLDVDLGAEQIGNGATLPITATFLLDGAGRIVARHVDPDPRARMESEAILQATLGVQSAARS